METSALSVTTRGLAGHAGLCEEHTSKAVEHWRDDEGEYFAGEDLDKDIKVCLITGAVIQESEWKEELLKDDKLQRLIERT
ncbi:hypothetical protein NDU88_002344 [Pleurodeles waltl]|uniref:Uncharacterized protein n=1 Tax=Pleurodeles waltl TaxID=8319 RepID=A0AAV7M3N2_PLEWA|nr:hypothetical protein NDU88_002344 [Pleurodeles waltl]